MCAAPYWYYVKYKTDIPTTLHQLRRREFKAGRYYPVMQFINFPITDNSPAPGMQHSSIEEAMEAAEAEGTRSILDLSEVSTIPYSEALSKDQYGLDLFCTTFPLAESELIDLFGTEKPSHEIVESVIVLGEQNQQTSDEFWENIDRGTGKHILIYENDEPIEVFFIGYSFD